MIKKIKSLLIVILAGETIFMLPFLVPRMYRPLMMEVWGVSNTEIGFAFSAYGLTAMISYFLGGPFADKFAPRGLIVISLIATSLGSSVLLLNPSAISLTICYAFFGMSTIFLMWSALIKVTHEIGGERTRATAMGLLEGGRGFVAAVMSSFLVFVVGQQTNASGVISNKPIVLSSIYFSISAFILCVSVVVWFGLKNVETKEASAHDWSLEKAKVVFKDLNLWLLAFIILTAYCSYKNIGNYSIFLKDVKGMSIVEASTFTSYIFWVRPLSTIIAGIFADKLTLKVQGGRFITLTVCFLLGGVTQLLLALDIFTSLNLLLSTILFSSCFAFALRAIYFSVFGDFQLNDSIIGTAVGIVSLVGYLPDFFFGTLTGYLIDTYPGSTGFSYVFIFNGVMLLVGTITSYICYRRVT